MKKLLLFILVLAVSNSLLGQVSLEEDFNVSFPAGWLTIDNGHNPNTWEYDADGGRGETGCLYLDTYEADSTDSGIADDWFITSQFSVASGDILTFWVDGGYDEEYTDSITVFASKTGTNESDFTIEIGGALLTGEGFIKVTLEVEKNADLSVADDIYLGFHCESNGSSIYFDDLRVGPYVPPMFTDAYTINDTTIHILYDDDFVSDSIDKTEFELMGSADILFDEFEISSENTKMLKLYSTTDILGDNIIDTLVYNKYEDTLFIYAGLMPLEFTSLTNPGGTMDEGFLATFTGIVTATNNNDRVWIADEAGAHHGINSGDGAFNAAMGDSLVFYGKFSPYSDHSEIYPATLIKNVGPAVGEIAAFDIAASDIDTSINYDTDPAEKYESSLVTVSAVTIDEWDGSYYYYATSGANVVRIGDRFETFDGTFNGNLLNVGTTYNITGIVVGRSDEYQICPRNLADINPTDDATKPVVTNAAQEISNVIGNIAEVKSNEAGKVYIILEGQAQSSLSDLNAAVSAYKGACAEAFPNDTADIAVMDLMPGTYFAYAVDLGDNISDKGTNAITITSGAKAMPYSEDFEESLLIPSDMQLINKDGGTPATSLETYQNLADSAFIVRLNEDDFVSNIALGTSWYDETTGADDWLILPKIQLDDNALLTWDAMSLTTSGDYRDDYEIYVSTTTATVEAFMMNDPVYSVIEEEASETADNPGDGVQTRSVNLADSGYVNVDAYIAFRLMTPYNYGDRLGLDNIMLTTADETAPVVSNDAQTVIIGDDVQVQSSEPTGKVYIILDGEPQTTVADLDDAVNSSVGATADVTAADTDISISTSGLIAGTYYAYAVDSAQNMSAKGTNAISVSEQTSIEDELFKDVLIYPNPVNSLLTIENVYDVSEISVINTIGQEIKRVNINGEQLINIDFSGLNSGLYFISFYKNEEVIKSTKIIKK